MAEAASATLSDSERVSALTRLYLAEAEAWRQLGDAAKSLTARTQALQVQPDGGDLGEWLLVGRSWYELKRFEQAAAAGKVMLTADPRSVPANLLLLQASAGLGQVDTAIGYGRVAWSLSPSDPDIALMMAQLHGARGEEREALQLLEAALQAHTDDARLGPAIQRLRAGP